MSEALDRLNQIYHQPFFDLITQARKVYLENWEKPEVQLCSLLSIKTGGCSEDCSYCSQSSHYDTELKRESLMDPKTVVSKAETAKADGATRFCMGAAWKGVREGTQQFESVLEMVRGVSKLGMEVCVTLGSLTPESARQLKEAGVTAYNHNIDTSPEYYPKIVSTHTFDDRLNTIKMASHAGMSVCCGGIIGMGETELDRLKMLEVLMSFTPAPESVPINCLTPMTGTPLKDQPPIDIFQLVRLVATARVIFPKAKVRMSAGRTRLTKEGQALCFFAGANSIFFGDKLLTAENPEVSEDRALLTELGLAPQPSFADKVCC
ncbi:MAG: biotin synthase BioB [Verrucomicrobiota bacterium]|nr:biotin synthase BioB [Verrucomicrobiota bacterium]